MDSLIADSIQQNRALIDLRTGQEKYTTEARRKKKWRDRTELKRYMGHSE